MNNKVLVVIKKPDTDNNDLDPSDSNNAIKILMKKEPRSKERSLNVSEQTSSNSIIDPGFYKNKLFEASSNTDTHRALYSLIKKNKPRCEENPIET